MNWIYIICGALLILTGGVRLYLAQTGQYSPRSTFATVAPWFYLIVGILSLIYGLSES